MSKIACLVFFVSAALGAEFSYDRCDKSEGPSAWGGFCQNATVQQTPIDLCGAIPMSAAPTMMRSGYDSSRSVTIVNNGHTLQINNVNNPPMLQVGALASMVGRGTNTSTQTWVFAQMHLHWGRTGKTTEGSEHYVQGTQYPLEAHLVHYNSMYGSVSNAVGQPDGLLVVGVMYTLGSITSPTIQAIASAASTATATPTTLSSNVTLTDVFTGNGFYYSYGGSLTTPGCNPVVTWIVYGQPMPITASDLDMIKQAKATSGELISVYGNYRPLQMKMSTLYISSGSSASCSNPAEPTFTCTSSSSPSAAAAAFPSLLVHMGTLLFALFVLKQ